MGRIQTDSVLELGTSGVRRVQRFDYGRSSAPWFTCVADDAPEVNVATWRGNAWTHSRYQAPSGTCVQQSFCTDNGLHAVGHTHDAIFVWPCDRPETLPQSLPLPAGGYTVHKLERDSTGRYMLARLTLQAQSPSAHTDPGQKETASHSIQSRDTLAAAALSPRCRLMLWDTTRLKAGKPAATLALDTLPEQVSFAPRDVGRATGVGLDVFVHYAGSDPKICHIWAPGLRDAPFELPRHGGTADIRPTVFDRGPGTRVVTFSRSGRDKAFAQAWQLTSAAAVPLGRPLYFEEYGYRTAHPYLVPHADGIHFWHVDAHPERASLRLCALDAQNSEWTISPNRIRRARLSDDRTLILQEGLILSGLYVWNADTAQY